MNLIFDYSHANETRFHNKGFELRACLHGGGGPQVGEVTRLGGVTRLSGHIISHINLITFT